MNYLLDSNTVSDLYNRSSPQHNVIFERFSTLTDVDSVYVSILTLYEMEYGYANAPDDKKAIIRQQIQAMCNDLELLPLTKEAVPLFGVLKKSVKNTKMLSSKNIKQHSVDIMIAANAIFYKCVVVSEDKLFVELAKLDTHLKIENWSE